MADMDQRQSIAGQVLHVSGGTANAVPGLLITAVVLCLRSVAWRMLCNSFCTSASPNTWVSCRIRGSEGRIVYLLVAVGWVGQRREKRQREVVKTAFYPLLSCFLSVTSFTPLLLPKAGKRSKEANMKGIPEILFFAALSCCSLHYRYGNAESQIQPVPIGCRDCPASFDFLFRFLFQPLLSSPSSYLFLIISFHPLLLPLFGSPQASRQIAFDWQLL